MAKLPSGFRHHAICHDQSVAVLGIALAQQADCLVFGKSYRLAEIDQRFRLVHMSKKNALEAFDVPGARCVPPALWCAEATQMAIADAGLGQVGGKPGLGEALLRETGAARMSRISSTHASLSVRMKAAMVPLS